MAERRARVDYYVGPRDRVKREDLPRLEATGEWRAEVKHDGVWSLATFEDGVLVSLSSRTGLALAAPDLLGERCGLKGSGQLAGELVSDAEGEGEDAARVGQRRLHLFEALNWNGHDLRGLPLEERREALEMIYGTLALPDRLFLVERRESGFLNWYDALLAGDSKVIGKRAEGLVLKKKGTTGHATCADGKVEFWLRCKPLNTVDYVVIGPDGVAAKGTPKVALGLFKQTKLGRRVVKVMSPTAPRFPVLPGQVVEVEGAELFPSGALRHGHITRVRTDKRAEDCTYEAAVASGG